MNQSFFNFLVCFNYKVDSHKIKHGFYDPLALLRDIYIIKSGVCLSLLECTNVTSPPVLKLWDSQGYLWLPYDLTEVINLIGVTFKQKIIFLKKKN